MKIFIFISVLFQFQIILAEEKHPFLTPTEIMALSSAEQAVYFTEIRKLGHPLPPKVQTCINKKSFKSCRISYLSFAYHELAKCKPQKCENEIKTADEYRKKIKPKMQK